MKVAADGSGLYDRGKARLHALQLDASTYIDPPRGSPEQYTMWLESFSLDQNKGEISELLVSKVEVRALYTRLVPSEVSNADFWQRYFYRVHQLQCDEARKQALMMRADQTRKKESVSWDDDDDDDDDFGAEGTNEDDDNHSDWEKMPPPPQSREAQKESFIEEDHRKVVSRTGKTEVVPTSEAENSHLVTSQRDEDGGQSPSMPFMDQEHLTDKNQAMHTIPNIASTDVGTPIKEGPILSPCQHAEGEQSGDSSEWSPVEMVSYPWSLHIPAEDDLVNVGDTDREELKDVCDREQVDAASKSDAKISVDKTVAVITGNDSSVAGEHEMHDQKKTFPVDSLDGVSNAASSGGMDQTSNVIKAKESEPHEPEASLVEPSSELAGPTSHSPPQECTPGMSSPSVEETDASTSKLASGDNNEAKEVHACMSEQGKADSEPSSELAEFSQSDTPNQVQDHDFETQTEKTFLHLKDTVEENIDTTSTVKGPQRPLAVNKVECDGAEIGMKVKGDMIVVGDRDSPSSTESADLLKDLGLGEDWEQDFDVEITEEDLKAAEDIARRMGGNVDEDEDDWENWE